MGFSIHYRSTETMHPALAYEIRRHADRLIGEYTWLSCEPVSLEQHSDGHLRGSSKPNFFPAEVEPDTAHIDGMPDGTILTLAEVLCTLSREHGISWDIGHDYEPDPVGRISDGFADNELIEQLETFGSIGDLFDDLLEEEDSEWETPKFRFVDEAAIEKVDDESDDDGPHVLKFPGME